jgi:dihydroorotase
MSKLVIRRPDDFHVHFREGELLKQVAPYTARVFARALVMPNTKIPIRQAGDAVCYKREIMEATGQYDFQPLLTIKLLRSTTPEQIANLSGSHVIAGKLYPEGVTHNSSDVDAVSNIYDLFNIFEAMEDNNIVLCLHGEDPRVPTLRREHVFLCHLQTIAATFPKLRIVLEHITTAAAVEVVSSLSNVAATITAHHLYLTLDDMIGGNLNPHAFCKPVAKTIEDKQALIRAATSGDPKFFFGSDSAPHLRESKECASGCAGIFSAPCAVESIIPIFDDNFALNKVNDFMSTFGAMFYGLPLNEGSITLERIPWIVPKEIHGIVPFHSGKQLAWRISS